MSSLPKWICNRLTNGDLQKIEAEIASIEKTLSVEIVPLIVKQSSATGHVPWVIFLFLQLLVVTADLPRLQSELSRHFVNPVGWMILDVLVLGGVSFLMSHREELRRLLTARKDRVQQVWRRAHSEFLSNKIQSTQGRNGILLMASLVERHAVVLTDEAILKVLPQDTWKKTIEILVSRASEGRLADGYVEALRELARQLEPHFKKEKESLNEISNRMILKE